MKVTLIVESGPDAGRSFTFEPGAEVRVGRKAPSHFVLPADPTLSRAHFSVECDGRVCRVRDLESTGGTEVNGVRVGVAFLNDGDVILAGSTTFVVRFDTPPPAPLRPPDLTADAERTLDAGKTLDPEGTLERETIADRSDLVLSRLRKLPASLFAVLDAARDPLVLARLVHCGEQYQSLYEGVAGQELAESAPYLVSLPDGSKFLEALVRETWGKSWGMYLTCPSPFKEVRKHLRRFLLVKDDGDADLYFRYYDPRVLRVFLPTCDKAELREFFGPIQTFAAEGDDPDVLCTYEFERQVLKSKTVAVDGSTARQ